MLCSALTHKRNNNHFLLRLSISFYFLSFHIYPIDILLSIYTTSKFAPCYHLSNPNVVTLVQSFTFCFVYFCYQCPFCVSLTLCISCLSLSCQSTYCFLSTRPQNSLHVTICPIPTLLLSVQSYTFCFVYFFYQCPLVLSRCDENRVECPQCASKA